MNQHRLKKNHKKRCTQSNENVLASGTRTFETRGALERDPRPSSAKVVVRCVGAGSSCWPATSTSMVCDHHIGVVDSPRTGEPVSEIASCCCTSAAFFEMDDWSGCGTGRREDGDGGFGVMKRFSDSMEKLWGNSGLRYGRASMSLNYIYGLKSMGIVAIMM